MNLIPVYLTYLKTSDGLTLEGIYVPPKRKSKTALIWLHGLSSRFSSGQNLIKELSSRCQKSGIGYFKFNTRGHDVVNRDGHRNKKLQGGGFEKFEECVLDVRAMINFAKKLGYKKFVLAGHSTGANKALYYLYQTRDRAIKWLILLGPISDIVAETKRIGKQKLSQSIKIARELKKKNPHFLMPQFYGIYNTPERYLSLYNPGSKEDVFPYHNPGARWKELKSVRIPTAVIVGSRDEYLDQPAKKLIEVFKQKINSTKYFSGITVKDANHGFYKKERQLARIIVTGVKKVK